MGHFNQNWQNNGQKVPKWPLNGPINAVFHNLSSYYHHSDFFSEKNALGCWFWAKLSKTNFFCPKKDVLLLLGGIHHLALLFFGLNLRDLHQTSGIWCEIAISGVPPQLDWLRSKKTGKIRKQCYQTLFSVWRLSTKQITANYILTKFRDILSTKSVILAQFSIFGLHH